MPFSKANTSLLLFALLSASFYLWFAYDLVRTEPLKLILLYSGLFFIFYKLVKTETYDIRFLIVLSIVFRILFLFAIPNLSQDFYRFIWDGRMILNGFNPYLYTPESFISSNEFPVTQAKELYDGMGLLNASHYTNYPPINQLCFVIAGIFSGKSILGSVVVMRLLIILADIAMLYFGMKLLEKLKIPIRTIFWYVLNPFIIIELTGNLHFESIMLFFIVWSLYLLQTDKWKLSAVIFSFSILVKLIPILFLPLLLKKLGFKKSIGYYSIVGLVILVFFAPFYSQQFVINYAETVGLWFQKFEFNASVYYILRWIGYQFRGWNEIAIIGKVIPVFVIAYVLFLTFYKRNKSTIGLIRAMLFALSFYYFTTTTVHPWYVSTLLILSVFTNYKFPLVWSFIVVISYFAYTNDSNTENLWIIGFEYSIVYAVLIWELVVEKRLKLKAR